MPIWHSRSAIAVTCLKRGGWLRRATRRLYGTMTRYAPRISAEYGRSAQALPLLLFADTVRTFSTAYRRNGACFLPNGMILIVVRPKHSSSMRLKLEIMLNWRPWSLMVY